MRISILVNSFIRRLSVYGYKCSKSLRSIGHSYYFKSEKRITIRLSDHHLHPKQQRENFIDIIINEDEATVNNKPLYIESEKAKLISRLALERILLECKLYGKPMPLKK